MKECTWRKAKKEVFFMTKGRKNIYILRKDLRNHQDYIEDSVFYYFWNEDNLQREKRGTKYKNFLKKSLDELKSIIENSNGNLKVINGGIIEKVTSIFEPEQVENVFIQKQYLPWEREEEKYLNIVFPRKVRIIQNGFLLTVPGEVLKEDGRPYVVFTPFYKKWLQILSAKYYSGEKYPKEDLVKTVKLQDFFIKKLDNYGKYRDFPALEGTSGFSKYLNCGVLSPESILKTALSLNKNDLNWELFLRQLAWRDFYYHLYYYFPYVLEKAFKEKYQNIYWDNNLNLFEKWQKGLTGYPFVDAGMRQLSENGFMHNRLRMITASFLTKDLLIDWKKGEEYFMDQLVDGDVILNNGGWQWSASTGADPQPWFRIFNPVTQSQKFDPKGDYIKRYLPELSNVPEKYIHEPWKMSVEEQKKYKVIIGKDYPFPIVDHKEQRLRSLELYNI